MFDENNLYFLRHVLIDKLGLNLRHEVSHALLTFDEYGGKAELLFVVVLRVAFPISELDDGGGGSEAESGVAGQMD